MRSACGSRHLKSAARLIGSGQPLTRSGRAGPCRRCGALLRCVEPRSFTVTTWCLRSHRPFLGRRLTKEQPSSPHFTTSAICAFPRRSFATIVSARIASVDFPGQALCTAATEGLC